VARASASASMRAKSFFMGITPFYFFPTFDYKCVGAKSQRFAGSILPSAGTL